MKLLFVHQSFPGQYRHLLLALSSIGKHEICGLGIEPLSEPLPSGVLDAALAMAATIDLLEREAGGDEVQKARLLRRELAFEIVEEADTRNEPKLAGPCVTTT